MIWYTNKEQGSEYSLFLLGISGLVPLARLVLIVYIAMAHKTDENTALNGSKHLELLVGQNLLNPISLPGLEQLYAKRVSGVLEGSATEPSYSEVADDIEQSEDRVLLKMSDAKKLATILEAPELVLEAERAIIQVGERLEAAEKTKQENKDEKKDS